MTNTQNRILKYVKDDVMYSFYGHTKDDYEVKTFRVHELGWTDKVLVEIECGLKGDENTLASIYCRNRVAFWLGPRGGRWYDTDACKKKPLTSYFIAYYEQKYGSRKLKSNI